PLSPSRELGNPYSFPTRRSSDLYNQAFNVLTEKAVNVRSEARDAYRVYRSTYDIAGHYQREVLPLRQIITEEMQLRSGRTSRWRSEEHTSELQSHLNLVCRLLLE